MKWNIITDSSCDMFGFEKEHENIVFSSVPFTISVGDENFVDDRNLDVDGMIDSMDACAEASHTACPSPHAWQEKFEQEGNVIAITISSKLSGSYNSACAAKDMVLEEQPDKKIAVIDSRSAGSELVLLVKKSASLSSPARTLRPSLKRRSFIPATPMSYSLSRRSTISSRTAA